MDVPTDQRDMLAAGCRQSCTSVGGTARKAGGGLAAAASRRLRAGRETARCGWAVGWPWTWMLDRYGSVGVTGDGVEESSVVDDAVECSSSEPSEGVHGGESSKDVE